MMLLNVCVSWLAFFTFISSVQGFIETPEEKLKLANKISAKKNLCRHVPIQQSDELQVICRGVESLQDVAHHFTKDQLGKITALNFTMTNFSSLSLDDLVDLPSVHTITFSQCFISDWKVPKAAKYPRVTSLILDDSWNTYVLYSPHRNSSLQLTSSLFEGLQTLEELHLSKCYVSNMTAEIFGNITSFKKLHIRNDCGIGCEPQMEWLVQWMEEGKAELSNDTICFVARDTEEGGGGLIIMSTFYSFSGHPFRLIMGHHEETKKHCPKECRCIVEGYNVGRNGHDKKPIINIYCDNAGLTEVPDIPPYSSRINFGYNNITDISKIFTNKNYRNVTSVRLEHNMISYVDGDLFSNFMNGRPHDIFFMLDNNNLSTLPVKQMLMFYKGAQDTHSYDPFFTLKFNPWNCSDCNFIPGFQELVYHQYYFRLRDNKVYDEVRCAEGSEVFSGQMVVKLDVLTLCAPDAPLLEPIDMINISLGFIIIIIAVNFAYDFYQYKRHSKLPWIISRVPCC